MRTDPRSFSTSSALYGRTMWSHRDAMDAGVLTSVGPRMPCGAVKSLPLPAPPVIAVPFGSVAEDCRFDSGYATDMGFLLEMCGSKAIGLSRVFGERRGSQKLVSRNRQELLE